MRTVAWCGTLPQQTPSNSLTWSFVGKSHDTPIRRARGMREVTARGEPSRAWRGPPGREHSDEAQQYQRQGNWAPPVLPEGTKAMAALTPCPEDAEKEKNGADDLANPTHSLKTIPRL